MIKKQLVFMFLMVSTICCSQVSWQWSELAPLPEAVTNNAIVSVKTANQRLVYSFGGIRNDFHADSVVNSVYQYNIFTDEWESVENLPVSEGLFGAKASSINGKIMIMGGASLDINQNEVSSDQVFVFNPENNSFESSGAPMPVATDDHVQVTWRDSLIYVFAGKNNGQTVAEMQIYNPSIDQWVVVNSFPNVEEYETFGASGYILKDTIYYYGGVLYEDDNVASNVLRKGVINPNNPQEIEWSIVSDNFSTPLFRAACSGHNETLFWVGGSKTTYPYQENYSNGTTKPLPTHTLIEHEIGSNTKITSVDELNNVMDVGGIANIGGGNWILAGGLDSLEHTSKKVFLLHNPALSDIEFAPLPPYFEIDESTDFYTLKTENIGTIKVYDISGRTLYKRTKSLADLKIAKANLQKGILLFVYENNISLPVHIKKINL